MRGAVLVYEEYSREAKDVAVSTSALAHSPLISANSSQFPRWYPHVATRCASQPCLARPSLAQPATCPASKDATICIALMLCCQISVARLHCRSCEARTILQVPPSAAARVVMVKSFDSLGSRHPRSSPSLRYHGCGDAGGLICGAWLPVPHPRPHQQCSCPDLEINYCLQKSRVSIIKQLGRY